MSKEFLSEERKAQAEQLLLQGLSTLTISEQLALLFEARVLRRALELAFTDGYAKDHRMPTMLNFTDNGIDDYIAQAKAEIDAEAQA